MGKRSDKRRAKKKAEHEKKRKVIAKQKLENLRKSNQETKEKSLDLTDTLSGIQNDIREQINNIDSSREICKALQKYTFTVVTKRLDIPYITDDIKDKFKGLHERITETIKHISDIRVKFVETAIKLQNPGKLTADVESLQKYSDVLNSAQELMNMQSSLVDFGAECAQFIRDLNKVIVECDKLREEHGDMTLIPIATPEEKKFLGISLDLETYEFKNKENDTVSMKTEKIPETMNNVVKDIPEEHNDTVEESDSVVEEKEENPVNRQLVVHYDENGKRID